MSLRELKTFDYIIIAIVIAFLTVGTLVYFGKNKFSKSPVEATKKIAFQVMLKSVSVTDSEMPFKIGEDSFLTIRNVPYTKLQIVDVMYQPKKTIVPIDNDQQPFMVIDDYSQPYQFDFIVTLIDEAKITKDGPVVGGNKIKIGLPIVLEGFNYRVGGTISNVKVLENKDLEVINKYVKDTKLKKQIEVIQQAQEKATNETSQKSTNETKTESK